MSATIPPFETIDILPSLGMRICPADCKIVKGNVPSYCPNADPPIPEAFLPDVENAFRRFPSLLPPGHTIHWIGRRAWQRNLCRCNAAPAADTGRNQAGTGNAEETTDGARAEGLSDRQRLILETMLEHEITSERRRKSRDAIVKLINRMHKASSYGRDFAALAKPERGMLQTREGPGGGVWLTREGKKEAERLRSSS